MYNTIRSKTVAVCLATITTIATNDMVELHWIAAYSGLWGNEKVHELAEQGTTHDIILN